MINNFSKKYRFLSNFWTKAPFTDEFGVRWKTSEHFYQAHKAAKPSDALKVCEAKTPGQSKRIGGKIKMNPDFPKEKYDIMWESLKYKFVQNPDIRNKLIDTCAHKLVEGNTWHDNIWGDCSCPDCADIEGDNQLGKQLMKLRNLLKNGEL